MTCGRRGGSVRSLRRRLLLLLLATTEGQAAAEALHETAGRLLHAVGFGSTPQILPLRQAGMVLTFTMLLLSGLGLIGHALV